MLKEFARTVDNQTATTGLRDYCYTLLGLMDCHYKVLSLPPILEDAPSGLKTRYGNEMEGYLKAVEEEVRAARVYLDLLSHRFQATAPPNRGFGTNLARY